MNHIAQFAGTWVGDHRVGRSDHTFTWTLDGDRLRGRWIIDVSARSSRAASPNDGGRRYMEMQVGEPWIEDGVVFFNVNESPFVTEFRLVSHSIAIAGAAVDKLPSQCGGQETHRSFEAHRVQFERVDEALHPHSRPSTA